MNVGSDYLSNLLWNKYIEFELSQDGSHNITNIYKRILKIPLRDLDKYWER